MQKVTVQEVMKVQKLLKDFWQSNETFSECIGRLLSAYRVEREYYAKELEMHLSVGDYVKLIEVPASLNFEDVLPEQYPLKVGEKGRIIRVNRSGLTFRIYWDNEKINRAFPVNSWARWYLQKLI